MAYGYHEPARFNKIPAACFTMAQSSTYSLRPIAPADDPAMAGIIRRVMTDYGAVGPGYSINDPEVDFISSAYSQPRCAYFVVEQNGDILGGAGIAPLIGADLQTCELRKMYLLPDARGKGAGAALMRRCMDAARGAGYRGCYLETLNSMREAARLYERCGFQPVSKPLGATGHSACERWYLLKFG
jgi:putative acetyltransferase